jgi:hypothetical protein
MGGIQAVRVAGLGLALAVTACSTPQNEIDLATNRNLYTAPNHRARVPADRSAFVAPVVDARGTAVVEAAAGPYPTRWMPEGYWQRPLPEMLHDCLCDAFEQSGVFAGLEQTPPPGPATLIVEPSLVEAMAGQEERVFGRRSLATLGLRIVIHGPAAADGTRPVLLDEQYDQSVGSDVAPQPPIVPKVFGLAVSQAIARILAAIDQGNLARSGMPPKSGG